LEAEPEPEAIENNGDVEMHDAEDAEIADEKEKPQSSPEKAKQKEVQVAEKKATIAPKVKPTQEPKKGNDIVDGAEPTEVGEEKPEPLLKKPVEKAPSPLKETAPAPVVAKTPEKELPVAKEVTSPVVEPNKDEPKEETSPAVGPAVVSSAASTVTNSNYTPEKKIPSLESEAKAVVNSTNGNSTPSENSTVSPVKAE